MDVFKRARTLTNRSERKDEQYNGFPVASISLTRCQLHFGKTATPPRFPGPL